MRKKLGKIRSSSLATRYRRKLSLRQKIAGTAERPRISVTKTNKHFFVQMVDDDSSKTICAVQTFGKNAVKGSSRSVEGAKVLGAEIASQLKTKKIGAAVLDRSGHRYTGMIAAMADSIRENGIQL